MNETSLMILEAIDRRKAGRRSTDIRLTADWVGYGLWCVLGLASGILGTLWLTH